MVLPPKNICQQFEMHKVHGNASSWDVMNWANPSVYLYSIVSQLPSSLTSSSPSPHPSPLTSILCFPAQWSSCSPNKLLLCFPGAISAPCCSQGTRWSGCLHTQGVKPLNGFCRTWLLRKARAKSAPLFPLIPVPVFMVL